MKQLGIICGGSGSSKFAMAFSEYSEKVNEYDLGFIANVGDNYWYHGLYICPDVDIIMHALAGRLDSKGWGIAGDSLGQNRTLSALSKSEEWFVLGDSDSAYCQRRTQLMKLGWLLSSVTETFRRALKIKHPIIPATDEDVTTFVRTHAGIMHLQQYWVKYKSLPTATDVVHFGIDKAVPNASALEYIHDSVIICPANPVTSILPTTRLTKVRRALRDSKVVAISPFIGSRPFSGPADKLMFALGIEPSSFGVASLYSSFLKLLVIDSHEDQDIVRRIEDNNIECLKMNTRIDENSKEKLAKDIMNAI